MRLSLQPPRCGQYSSHWCWWIKAVTEGSLFLTQGVRKEKGTRKVFLQLIWPISWGALWGANTGHLYGRPLQGADMKCIYILDLKGAILRNEVPKHEAFMRAIERCRYELWNTNMMGPIWGINMSCQYEVPIWSTNMRSNMRGAYMSCRYVCQKVELHCWGGDTTMHSTGMQRCRFELSVKYKYEGSNMRY